MPPTTHLFVFDTETHAIRPGLLAPPLVCVSLVEARACGMPSEGPLVAPPSPGLLFNADDGAFAIEKALLSQARSCMFVGHNIAYDFAVLAAHRPRLIPFIFDAYDAGRVSDTGIREKLIRLATGDFTTDMSSGSKRQSKFSMAAIFAKRFQIDLSADKDDPASWRLRYNELDGIPVALWPAAARDYAIGDAERTYQLWCAQASDTYSGVVDKHTGLVTNEQEQAAAAFCLHLMGVWGVRTDHATVEALAARLEGGVKEVRDALTDPSVALFRAKDGSKDVKRLRALIDAAYLGAGRTPPSTEKGGTSTAKETLLAAPVEGQQTVLGGIPVLQALASISADEHNHSTYIPAFRHGVSVPINCGWNVLVESGRTSAWGPNWQNLPRVGGYRECVVPRPGWMFINADYSTIELCALAQVCLDQFGYSEMARALQGGRDLHLEMAADLLGITYEQAYERRKSPEVKEARQMSKALNFGFPGGLGPETLCTWAWATYRVKFGESPEEATEAARGYKNRWLARWPEMREFFRMVSMASASGGGQFTLVQPKSGRLRGGAGYCDGCNSYFQGLAADGAKAAMFYISQECYTGRSALWKGEGMSPLFGSRLTMFVHDEFIGESPEEQAPAAAERLSEVMAAGMKLYLPDIPVKCAPVLMRRWYKDAEEVRDENGTLVPWEPKEKA